MKRTSLSVRKGKMAKLSGSLGAVQYPGAVKNWGVNLTDSWDHRAQRPRNPRKGADNTCSNQQVMSGEM